VVRDLIAAPRRAWPSAVVPALLAAWLFALPIRSTVAIRNVLLWSAVVLLAIAAARARDARRLVPARPLLAVLLAWSAWCVASVAWSVVPGASLSELRPELLTPVAVFLAFHACTDRASRIDLWSASLAASLAVLALLAMAMEAATGAWDPRRWHVDVGYYSTFVVTWWTDNRIVWPALALMVAVAAILAWPGATRRQRMAWALAAGVALAGAAALFVAAQHERAETLRRVRAPMTPDLATDPRLHIWPQALERWTERPLAGRGFGRPALAMPADTRDGIQDPRYWHAHNVFLDVALELGLVGLALFVAGLEAIAWLLARRGLPGAPAQRALAILGLALLAGFVAKNFTDDFLVRHVALLCAALAGILAAAMREDFAATS